MTSDLEYALQTQLRAMSLPEPVREYRFHPVRKWRFDFAYPDRRLAIEINGAVFTQGRHARGLGLEGDYEKLNTAQIMGWKVLQFSGTQIKSGYAIGVIEEALR